MESSVIPYAPMINTGFFTPLRRSSARIKANRRHCFCKMPNPAINQRIELTSSPIKKAAWAAFLFYSTPKRDVVIKESIAGGAG